MMTREEKTEAIIKAILDSLNSSYSADEWIREAIFYGRVGLYDMSDGAIQIEYDFWCDDEIDEEIDKKALEHEAATNNT
jgi:hypothetical protein